MHHICSIQTSQQASLSHFHRGETTKKASQTWVFISPLLKNGGGTWGEHLITLGQVIILLLLCIALVMEKHKGKKKNLKEKKVGAGGEEDSKEGIHGGMPASDSTWAIESSGIETGKFK